MEKAATLPPHDEEWEHQIELEEGAIPPYGPIYPHSEEELQVLREYLVTNLGRNWIRPSRSSAGAGILFVPKKGGGKPRLCVESSVHGHGSGSWTVSLTVDGTILASLHLLVGILVLEH